MPPGKLSFEFTHGPATPARSRDPEDPLRLLLIADFSGRANRGIKEDFATRKALRVDTDRFDEVMANLGSTLVLPLAGATAGSVTLQFAAMDDFHPDALLKAIPSLAELLTIRKDLDSSKAADAAGRLQSLLQLATPATPGPEASGPAAAITPDREAPGETAGETLERLLGKAPPAAPLPATDPAPDLDAQAIIKRILSTPGKPTPPPPAGLPGLINAAEMALSERLRSLLSHPNFQAVEAAWRGLDLVIRRCPDEERISLFILDATLEEIAADVNGLHRLLRDSSWGTLIGGFQFGKTTADLAALAALGALAQSLHASIIGGGDSRLVGCDSFGKHPDPDDWKHLPSPDVDQAWGELRASAFAPHIGLTLPRFLLRQPYGKAGDPIERFNFEEITDDADHENFLWGNSALLCAHLIAEGHAAGETIAAGNVGDLQPAHYQEHGGTALKPCAEAWLVDRAADAIARKGCIAVQSFKGRDAAQVTGIHAICHPDKPSRIFS